ncbi:MAG: hypothetical protein U1F16_09435 [Turneriella sp.]
MAELVVIGFAISMEQHPLHFAGCASRVASNACAGVLGIAEGTSVFAWLTASPTATVSTVN